MRINRITVYRVVLPLPGKPYHLSGGRVFETLDSTVVAIETDGGVTGWGVSAGASTSGGPAPLRRALISSCERTLFVIGAREGSESSRSC